MPGKPKGTGVRGHRLNPSQSQRCREAIKTTQIIKRLNSFVLGEKVADGTKEKKAIELSATQVTAAVALLKKTIPDLQTIDGALDHHVFKHEQALDELD